MEANGVSLAGKTAVVVGGSRGFGRGIVEALAGQAMRVLVVARQAGPLDRLRAEIGADIETISADAADGTVAVKIIQRERPQVLVLSAGSFAPIQETRLRTWETFSVNWEVDVKSTFLWTREALLAPLDPGSRIVIVSSQAAGSRFPAISGYIAAKTAQVVLARCLAVEAQPLDIRVQYLLPSLTPETELGHSSIQTFARRAGVDVATIVERNQLEPFLTPAGVGQAVVQILTDAGTAEVGGFKVSGEGLEPMPADTAILSG